MSKIGIAGSQDSQTRSDCYIKVEIDACEGIEINLESKVLAMYGNSIKKLAKNMFYFFKIENVRCYINDKGALPFVLCARLETAIKRAIPEIKEEYLLPQIPVKENISFKERFRRSRLYLPGNEPKFMINAGLHGADGIILDLEDSVSITEKDAARILVRNALRSVDFYNSERMVRINQLPMGLKDLEFVIPHNVNIILIPKCESPSQVEHINQKIKELAPDKKHSIFLMPIIESALGVVNAYNIASSCPEIAALAIGLEDYTADIGTQRTLEGKESIFARCRVINAAKANRIQAIDTVFSDVNDEKGLIESVIEAKSLGFEGKGCIHPRQIKPIHEAFAPGKKELEKAKKIVLAFREAEAKGLGVVSLGSKMIDPPVVKRALKSVDFAISLGIMKKDWMEKPD